MASNSIDALKGREPEGKEEANESLGKTSVASNSKRRQLMLKYILFKSLGPDKFWFQKLNSTYVFQRYLAAFETVLANRKASLEGKTINVLDIGAGAGVLSVGFVRSMLKIATKMVSLSVTKIEGMKPVAVAVRRFFALHSTEFDSQDDTIVSHDVKFRVVQSISKFNDQHSSSDVLENHEAPVNDNLYIVIADPFSTILTGPTPVAGGFGSGLLSCVQDLQRNKHLQEANTFFFPAKVKLYVQLVFIPNQSSVPPMSFCLDSKIEGLDLSYFNVFRGNFGGVQRLDYTHMASVDHTFLSSPVCFKEFELKTFVFSKCKVAEELSPHDVSVTLPILESGQANAVMYWYSIDLGDGSGELSYHPTTMREKLPLCRQGVHLFGSGQQIRVESGMHYSLQIKINFEDKYPFRAMGTKTSNSVRTLPWHTQLKSKDVSGVSRWHYSMLCDHERNIAYERALSKALNRRRKAKVIDIGTGTGLLAMMAARNGANEVVACELNPAIALVAEKIVEKNAFDKIVQVMPKKSSDLEISSGESKFDVCVSEILDCGLLGENVLPTIADARKRLLKEDAIVIPHSAKVYGILLSLDIGQGAPISAVNTTSACNLDMHTRVFKPFTKGTSRYEQIRLNDLKHVKLSKPFVLLNNIDLASGNEPKQKEMLPYVDCIIEDGVANAVALFFDLYLDSEKEIVLTTSPLNTSTCWGQAIQIFDKEFFCKKGEPIILRATHDYTSVKIDVPQDMDFDS